MTDAPAPGSAPAAAPASGPGAAAPAAPAAATRPDWLPEAHWDAKAGIKPEFGQHYTELATFQKTETEKAAALKARKAEDIKFEIKLPDTVKVPEGMELKIDAKDPRLPAIRDMALKHGWSQEQVNDLVAFDAMQKIADHKAESDRIVAEDKKLGEKVTERKDAVLSWAKGLKEKGDISAEEFEEIRLTGGSAAGVSLLEKLIAKASGAVPGTSGHQPQPKPADTPMEQRWYGPQQKVS